MSKYKLMAATFLAAVGNACSPDKPQETVTVKPSIAIIAGAFTGTNDQISIVTAEHDTLALASTVDIKFIDPKDTTAANAFTAFLEETKDHKNDGFKVVTADKVYQYGHVTKDARVVTGYINRKYNHAGVKFTQLPQ